MKILNTKAFTFLRHNLGFAAFPIILVAVLACSLSKFMPASNTSTSNSAHPANSTSDSSGSIAELCRNGYYPVSPTILRKYHISYPKGLMSDRDYTESFSDFSGDTFMVHTDFGAVKANVNWRCTAEGLFATQYNNSVDMSSGVSAKIDTIDSNGVSFPSTDKWVSGEKWNAEYHITESISSKDGKPIGSSTGTVKQDGEIVGSEEITVPAGSFQTMKVSMKTNLSLNMQVDGTSVPMNISLETTAWFAKDTGMVKSVTQMEKGGDVTSELSSFSK